MNSSDKFSSLLPRVSSGNCCAEKVDDNGHEVKGNDPELIETEVETEAELLLYNITDTPPIILTAFCAIQACIQVVSLSLTSAILVSEAVCGTSHLTAKLMSSSMFLAGFTTFLQSTVGVRLPVFQGPTFHWIVPVLARAELSDWTCPQNDVENNGTLTSLGGITQNNSTIVNNDWQFKLSEIKIISFGALSTGTTAYGFSRSASTICTAESFKISGVLMVVSTFHAVIGALGLGGVIIRVIGPLTVAPAVTVMILQLTNKLMNFTLIHLGISAFTICLMVICTIYMSNVLIPLPSWKPKQGWRFRKSRFIRTYAVIISLATGWLLCYFLTLADVFSKDPKTMQYHARTDNKWDTVHMAEWFYVPYPGQFGPPRFSVSLFFGLLVAMFSSVIDSVADYNIVSRLCLLPKVPAHATNRGLLTEGFCSVLAGIFGLGHATSTYVAVTGSLAVTGVTSLRVFQVSGLLLMFVGVVGKVGAFLVTIPKPVIGSVMIVVLASVVGVLLADLKEVDLRRPRNGMTVGLAILLGTMIPKLLKQNQDLVNTGVNELDQAIKAICGTPLFVAGVVACFLDNTLPAMGATIMLGENRAELVTDHARYRRRRSQIEIIGRRGEKKQDINTRTAIGDDHMAYRLPYVHDYLVNHRWTKYCPFLPGFQTKSKQYQKTEKSFGGKEEFICPCE